jgi:type III restriction enzyme
MKLHFDPNLSYQQEAIASVVKLFEGAPFVRPEDRLFSGVSVNRLPLTPEAVFKNRDAIAKDNGITNTHPADEMDFTVEMETGTGKTYVYLRSILELHKAYGLSKFIIVVPSIAVKEGVIKTLEMTREHFKGLYNTNYRYFAYDSGKPTDIRGFAQSGTLQIMVMNKQAFDSDDRIINQERDSNAGEKLIKLIEQTAPVVILDEPQMGMDTENFLPRLQALGPIFKLRYSATHKVVKNLIYQLTPFDAYNKRLVKTVEVLSIYEDDSSGAAIGFRNCLFDSRRKPVARLALTCRLAGGDFKEKTVSAKPGDELEAKTNNPAYRGWVVERCWKDINTGAIKVRFTNGTEILEGGSHGRNKGEIFREQIRWTIKKHLEKKALFRSKGIKVLSLFFIDKVANYIEEDGLIRRLFEEEYRKKLGLAADVDISSVHNGYFAKTGHGDYTDSEASMGKNSEVFQRIMRNKEQLLSFDDPLEFIFSHSALGVGWDNPNIFNICTLNETESSIKKRQEIGRGLRICVDQAGERVHDAGGADIGSLVNLLTVVPNQSYREFVTRYQEELVEDYGTAVGKPIIGDARRRVTARLNRDIFDSSDFDRLWERISRKTRWFAHFDEAKLIARCVEEVGALSVPEPAIKIDLNRLVSMDIGDEGEPARITEEHVGSESRQGRQMGDGIELDPAALIAKETTLGAKPALAIMEKVGHREFLKNPVVWLSKAIQKIKMVMEQEMVLAVGYEALDDRHSKSRFLEMFQTYGRTIQVDHGLYDCVETDSDYEFRFAEDLDREPKVRLFLKLPDWYEVDTPIGKYHPDWALVIEKTGLEGGKTSARHYFVVETKGTSEPDALRYEERAKIECAVKHFEAIGLKEYLAPIDTFVTLKEKANENIGDAIL